MTETEYQSYMLRLYRYCAQFAVPTVLLIVACWIKVWTNVEVDATVFVALLMFPLLGYLLFSGKLAELTGPGGWGVKFKAAAAESPPGEAVAEQDSLDFLRKSSITNLARRLAIIRTQDEASLVVKLGEHNDYREDAFRLYLCALLSIRYDPIVIFVDRKDRFIGSVPAVQVHALFCDTSITRKMPALESKAKKFIEQLNAGLPAGLTVLPLTRESLKEADSRKTALNAFMKTNAPALVVVDAKNTPVRLVKRDAVVAALLLALASPER
jgi:hypothetical protein